MKREKKAAPWYQQGNGGTDANDGEPFAELIVAQRAAVGYIGQGAQP